MYLRQPRHNILFSIAVLFAVGAVAALDLEGNLSIYVLGVFDAAGFIVVYFFLDISTRSSSTACAVAGGRRSKHARVVRARARAHGRGEG